MRLEQSVSGAHQYYRNPTFSTDKTKFEAIVKDIRDKFRAKFEINSAGEEAAKRIYVSSIAKWQGNSVDNIGYGFVIKIGAHQWFVLLMGSVGTSTSPGFGSFFQSTQVATYFTLHSSTSGVTPEATASSGNDPSVCFHYNWGDGSYNMGFTDLTTMRNNVGGVEVDFFTPTISPYSNASGFMPTQRVGGSIKGPIFSDTSQLRFSIVIDNEKPFMAIYFGSSNILGIPEHSWVLGKIIIPTTSGDTDGYASFRFANASDSPVSPGLTVYHPTTGAVTGYDISYDNAYDLISMWTNDIPPKLNFKSVQVIKSGLPQKGFIDTDIARVAGPNNRGGNILGNLIMNTPTGPLTCLCGDMFTPWGDITLSERYGYFVDYPVL